jgi:hypothetical protein
MIQQDGADDPGLTAAALRASMILVNVRQGRGRYGRTKIVGCFAFGRYSGAEPGGIPGWPRMRLAPSVAPPPPAETVDLFDPRLYSDGDPHNCWRRLRQDDPVRWQPVPGRGGFWSVTRYADAQQVMLDHGTFSSTGGVFLNRGGRG